MTSAPVERTVLGPLFLREFYFFSPGLKCAPPTEKKQGTQKLTSARTDGKSTTDCADFHRGHRIDQSRQFAQRWASGTAIPKIAPSLVFRSPRLFIEAMQFTDKRVYARAEKKIANTCTRARTSSRDDTVLIEFLNPRRSSTFHNACHISAGHSTSAMRIEREDWKGSTGDALVEHPRWSILSVNLRKLLLGRKADYARDYDNSSTLIKNVPGMILESGLLIANYSRPVLSLAVRSVIRCE